MEEFEGGCGVGGSAAVIVRDLAIEAADKKVHYLNDSSVPFIVLPDGYNIHDVSKFMDAPLRTRGVVNVQDAASFQSYFDMFKNDSTVLFSSEKESNVTAVFDHSTRELPGFGEHKLVMRLKASSEWDAWIKMNGAKMSQITFAEFIEQHIKDIIEPDGATMLEICHGIEATKNVEFKSGVRLDNGQVQLTYNETVQGSVQRGNIPIPQEFVIGVAPFKGGDLYRVVVLFRYRIEAGNLSLRFDIVNPGKVLEDAFKTELEKVEELVAMKAIRQ